MVWGQEGREDDTGERGDAAWLWGGGGAPPPPRGGAEFLEAPNKFFALNELAPKAPEKTFDRPKARRKIWPNLLGGGGGAQRLGVFWGGGGGPGRVGGWCGTPPQWCRVVKGSPAGGGGGQSMLHALRSVHSFTCALSTGPDLGHGHGFA